MWNRKTTAIQKLKNCAAAAFSVWCYVGINFSPTRTHGLQLLRKKSIWIARFCFVFCARASDRSPGYHTALAPDTAWPRTRRGIIFLWEFWLDCFLRSPIVRRGLNSTVFSQVDSDADHIGLIGIIWRNFCSKLFFPSTGWGVGPDAVLFSFSSWR